MSRGAIIGVMALVVLGILLLVLLYWIALWLVSWVGGVICDVKMLLGLYC